MSKCAALSYQSSRSIQGNFNTGSNIYFPLWLDCLLMTCRLGRLLVLAHLCFCHHLLGYQILLPFTWRLIYMLCNNIWLTTLSLWAT